MNLTIPKFFLNNLDKQEYPCILVSYGKHGDSYWIVNSRADLGQACMRIIKYHLELGYYEEDVIKLVKNIRDSKNLDYAIYFIRNVRSGGEYERVSVEYPERIK